MAEIKNADQADPEALEAASEGEGSEGSGASPSGDSEGGGWGASASPAFDPMSSDPNPDLGDIEVPWDPDNGGPRRIARGIQKALGVDLMASMPAAADVLIGAAETYVRYGDGIGGDESDDESAGAGEGGLDLE